jgi:hypothetical protein
MSDDDDVEMPQQKDRRMLAIGLALVAAACLGYAAMTKQWLVNGERVGFGLIENRVCGGWGTDECSVSSNAKAIEQWMERRTNHEYVSSAFTPAGWATLVELVVAAAGLVGAAALALARKRPQLPITPTTIGLLAIMGSLITGCVFVATKPGEAGFVGVGASFWIFGAGAILGIASAQMLAKINRPVDPDLMADAMNPEQF